MRHFFFLIFLTALFNNGYGQISTCISLLEVPDSSTNNAAFWNASYWYDAITELNNLPESPTALSWTVKDDDCAGVFKIGYQLALDLDGNGFVETLIDSDSLFNQDTIRFNNFDYYQGGIARRFDFRSVAPAERWRFGRSITSIGDTLRRISVIWENTAGTTTLPELPYGTHRITWRFVSSCGQTSTCVQTVQVKDGLPPTIVCKENLSVNLYNSNPPLVSLWAIDFLQNFSDNYSPAGKLNLGIRKSGTGNGFPVNSDGTLDYTVEFNCMELGFNEIDLWVRDQSGKTDSCVTTLLVLNNLNVCNFPGPENLNIRVRTDQNECVQDAGFDFEGFNNIPTFLLTFVNSGPNCNFIFPNLSGLPAPGTATIQPVFNADPLNGVNTYDLVLIAQHILGVTPITNPYRLLAADANVNGQITVFDIVEWRKLILGVYNELPLVDSWRFVNADQVFADPTNPFAEPLQDRVTFATLLANDEADFIGIKMGDIDGNAEANQLLTSDERTAPFAWQIADQSLTAGSTFTFQMMPEMDAKAVQFTLNTTGLELLAVEGLPEEAFALSRDRMTLAWFGDATPTITITARATRDGRLSDLLRLSDEVTRSVAFTADAQAHEQLLHFRQSALNGFEVFQNAPNPAHSSTNIDFYLPASGNVQLSLFDVNGRVVAEQNGHFTEGYQRFVVSDLERFPAGTMLYYRVLANGVSATHKFFTF
jgi:hypothetical protein